MNWDRLFLRTLEAKLPDILQLAKAAVDIDSGSYDREDVNRVNDVFEKALIAAGFKVEREIRQAAGDQLTARWESGRPGRSILILGHADTVWPTGTVEGWKFEQKDGLLTGPGVGDMKVCVATAIVSLRELFKMGIDGIERVVFLIVPDEEVGSDASASWIMTEARAADFCLTLEPARPNRGLVVGRGAIGHLRVDAFGITTHVGNNKKAGASALSVLARLVTRLEGLSDDERGVSVSVGLMQGGEARQVMPAVAWFDADLRARNKEATEALIDDIERCISEELASSDRRVTIKHSIRMRPPFEEGDGSRFLLKLAEDTGAALAIEMFPAFSGGGSDASYAASVGTPTLDGLGPITHEMCSRRERTEVSSIAEQGALLAGIIKRQSAPA
ncbi:M20/M25/M40 family metallo-hydrolase [Bradyrhizobium sp. SSUT77]|uniref:M20/M25/M40 family metallo-hydrolase n=1 Tax=Bradyrhizobium sp. SSUT77 TaxID=3040603 RepID=UPI002449DF53|nr:M20/M25/M40 family metallo-hydrolase [Bradyrhizobium sp. SSUT77]MDH2348369.1 M20/M25/M40 family metallo-hydrolase [Bradyrhizobium sp. SSUT77]